MPMSNWNWESAWPAPAKLNLFLHVVGRRPDGYHLLQTVFRFIDIADTLHFSPAAPGEVVLETPIPGVPSESDLTVHAARLLLEVTGVQKGVCIRLDKRLPMGGGLGGGSSDAATVLLALNHLWQTGLTRQQLQVLGLRLGADVPVFIHGRTSFAEGVGERFTDVTVPPAWYLVLVPPVAVPTAAIFGSSALRRDTPLMAPQDWCDGVGHNDLEAVACALFPQVAEHLVWLRRFGDARMSGSGACCFARFNQPHEAAAALAICPPGMTGFVAGGLDQHPLA